MKLKIKKLQKNIIGIKYPALEGDAGYDLYCAKDIIVPAKSSASVSTQVAIELPVGYWFEIMPKSGLATKHDIAVHNGVIDNGYRGEIIVHVYNHSNKDFQFKKDDKVAQGIIRKLHSFKIEEVEELSNSIRGNKGFGSTDKSK